MPHMKMNLPDAGYENYRLRKAKDDLRNYTISLIDKALTEGIIDRELPDLSLFKLLYDRQQELNDFVALNTPVVPMILKLDTKEPDSVLVDARKAIESIDFTNLFASADIEPETRPNFIQRIRNWLKK